MTFNSQELDAFLDHYLATWRAKWPSSALLDALRDGLRHYTKGGKRLRARGVELGFSLVADSTTPARASLLGQAAVEIYQGSALAHDDIVDNADKRRGAASLHRFYEYFHAASNFRGNREAFGKNSALLAGDLLLSLSQELANEASDLAPTIQPRDTFVQMTAEVAMGQFLDCALEDAPLMDDPELALQTALEVIKHKAARYSVCLPVVFGAQLAGVQPQVRQVRTNPRAVGMCLPTARRPTRHVRGRFPDWQSYRGRFARGQTHCSSCPHHSPPTGFSR